MKKLIFILCLLVSCKTVQDIKYIDDTILAVREGKASQTQIITTLESAKEQISEVIQENT